MAKTPFKLNEKSIRVLGAIKRSLEVMAIDSEAHFKRNFRLQGFMDETLKKWDPRKSLSRSDRRNKKRKRAILVDTGVLRNTIFRMRVSNLKYKIISAQKYSAIHNEGLDGLAFGRYKFKMPKRQFIGRSGKLIRKNILTLRKNINLAVR